MAHDRDDHAEEPRRRVSARAAGLVVAGVLLVWFGLANSERVQVSFFGYDREVRLVYALAVAAILGAVVGYITGRTRARRDR